MAPGLDNLVRLHESQVGPASEVLARAFLNDPAFAQLVPDESKRARLLPHLFRVELRHGIRYGEVYATSPRMEGIAIWLPSEALEMSLWTMVRYGGLALIFRMSWRLLWRLKKEQDFVVELHRRLAPFPHWYLAVLGVDPGFQGRGYSSRLVKPMLARAEAAGLPCYVETSTEGYVEIYRHFGFRVIHETVLPGSDSRVWVMLKKNQR